MGKRKVRKETTIFLKNGTPGITKTDIEEVDCSHADGGVSTWVEMGKYKRCHLCHEIDFVSVEDKKAAEEAAKAEKARLKLVKPEPIQARTSDFIPYEERLKEGPFDLIICDMPWSYDQGQSAVHSMEHVVSYETISDPTEMVQNLANALKKDRNLYIWCDWYTVPKLLDAGKAAKLKYTGLHVMARQNPTPGHTFGKQLYFVVSFAKGKAYRNKGKFLSEWLGQYDVKRSGKPQAVYDKIREHSLPPNGLYIDPFPPSHVEETRGRTKGEILQMPRLFSAEEMAV